MPMQRPITTLPPDDEQSDAAGLHRFTQMPSATVEFARIRTMSQYDKGGGGGAEVLKDESQGEKVRYVKTSQRLQEEFEQHVRFL